MFPFWLLIFVLPQFNILCAAQTQSVLFLSLIIFSQISFRFLDTDNATQTHLPKQLFINLASIIFRCRIMSPPTEKPLSINLFLNHVINWWNGMEQKWWDVLICPFCFVLFCEMKYCFFFWHDGGGHLQVFEENTI